MMARMKPDQIAPAFSTSRGAVYNTDCLNLLGALKDASVDVVFADPPFNIGKDYGRGKDKDQLHNGEYLRWCGGWIRESIRVLKPGGSIFVYNLPQWAYHLATYMESTGLSFRHWIAVSMKGTFPRGKKLYPAHYALLYFTKGEPKTFNRDAVRQPVPACRHCGGDIKDYGGHRKYLNPLGLNLTDIWDDTAPARHSQFKARWGINELKPIIPMRCIQISTNESDVVLDPFGGGGSTFEAAERLNRIWVGSEIVDCGLIRERFSRNLPNSPESEPRVLSGVFREGKTTITLRLPECQKSLKRNRSTEHNNSSVDSGLTNCSQKFARL